MAGLFPTPLSIATDNHINSLQSAYPSSEKDQFRFNPNGGWADNPGNFTHPLALPSSYPIAKYDCFIVTSGFWFRMANKIYYEISLPASGQTDTTREVLFAIFSENDVYQIAVYLIFVLKGNGVIWGMDYGIIFVIQKEPCM